MDTELMSAAPGQGRSAARGRSSRKHGSWIFGEAIQDCFDLLRLRKQTVMVGSARLRHVASDQQGPLARLLSLAIEEVSSVSCRGGILSLEAKGGLIMIQSHHPLDIPSETLPLDIALQTAADDLRIESAMTWEQGRGPRLTLSLPRSDGRRHSS